MRIRSLGQSGLTLSTLGLGTRTWGLDTEYEECDEMLRAFMGSGGTYLHLEADQKYPEPLETMGRLIKERAPREKLHLGVESGPFANTRGPGRGQLLTSLDAALRTLNTDYVDLWIVRGPRKYVPLSETLSALETAYKTGKARYVGLSNFSAWDFGQATGVSQRQSWGLTAWARPVSLLEPVEPDANFEAMTENGVGIIGGAPLAHGVLTGKYRHSTPADSRAASPRFRKEISRYAQSSANGILDGLARAAEGLDKSSAQLALAWAMNAPGVTTTVVGPRSMRQLSHLLEDTDWQLPDAIDNVLTEIAKK